MTRKQDITPEMLMAYADGQLDALTAKRVEKAIAANPEMAEQVEKHRALRANIRQHFDPILNQQAPTRLSAAPRDPAAVVDLGAVRQAREAKEKARAERAKPPTENNNSGRIAWLVVAALVAGVALGVTSRSIYTAPTPDQAMRGGQLVAQGEMAKGLDTQVTSQDGLVRLSFRNQQGEVCRVFGADTRSGIACRTGYGWTIRNYRSDSGASKDGQVGPASVMAAAQEMMAGAPLDVAAEKAAIAKGWR